jgi:hypothetical protein
VAGVQGPRPASLSWREFLNCPKDSPADSKTSWNGELLRAHEGLADKGQGTVSNHSCDLTTLRDAVKHRKRAISQGQELAIIDTNMRVSVSAAVFVGQTHAGRPTPAQWTQVRAARYELVTNLELQ